MYLLESGIYFLGTSTRIRPISRKNVVVCRVTCLRIILTHKKNLNASKCLHWSNWTDLKLSSQYVCFQLFQALTFLCILASSQSACSVRRGVRKLCWCSLLPASLPAARAPNCTEGTKCLQRGVHNGQQILTNSRPVSYQHFPTSFLCILGAQTA